MLLLVVSQNYVKKNNLLKEQEIIDAIFVASVLPGVIPFWILDLGFWILKALPIGSFRNSTVSSLSPNGIRAFNVVVDLLNHLYLMEKNLRSYAISKSAWLY